MNKLLRFSPPSLHRLLLLQMPAIEWETAFIVIINSSHLIDCYVIVILNNFFSSLFSVALYIAALVQRTLLTFSIPSFLLRFSLSSVIRSPFARTFQTHVKIRIYCPMRLFLSSIFLHTHHSSQIYPIFMEQVSLFLSPLPRQSP